MDYPKFKVCVRCFTFNQAAYITDALNGFTMQETDFPFVCCIVDDASTDGEPDVISGYLEEHFDFSEGSVACKKETDYAHIIYAQHKTNRNCYFAVLYLKENHYLQKKDKLSYLKEWRDLCEYEALCEGDDYWIVADKLQKQVDALDKDTNAIFSYTSFKTVDKNGKDESRPFFQKCIKRSHSGNVLFDLFKGNFILTLTVVYKQCVVSANSYFDIYNGVKFDYYLFMLLATKGDAIYINDITGCYRNNPSGLINKHNKEINNMILEVYKYFALGVVGGYLKRKMHPKVSCKLYLLIFYRALVDFRKKKDKKLFIELVGAFMKRFLI